jgi:hypothetical protein
MTTNSIDWDAAINIASGLGRRTLELVARRDIDGVREWALQMASACGSSSAANGQRAASYFELAVLAGHVDPKPENVSERLIEIETRLGSIETKIETLGEEVAVIVAEQDQAKAAAAVTADE